MRKCQADIGRGIGNGLRRHYQTGDGARNPARCSPKHDQQAGSEDQQAVFGKAGEHLRQQHDDRRPHQRTKGAACAADDHDEEKQDRLRERKRTRCDETGQRRLQTAGETSGRR